LASNPLLARSIFAQGSAAPTAAPVVQSCLVSSQELEAPELRSEWAALADCAAEPNPFFESWYLLPSLRALDPNSAVQLLRFDSDGLLAGLLPTAREARYYGWPIPHLRSWVHTNCFLGAPLIAAGMEQAFWRALLEWADANAGIALFLHLSHMPLNGPIYDALCAVLADQGRASALVHREDRALLKSTQSPDAYFEAAISAKKRKEMRRQYNRLSELGVLRFERQNDNASLSEWIEKFMVLEQSGWKGSGGSALASHHATGDLFRDALAGAAASGKLERLTLSLDAEPLAMLVNFLTPPGAFSYKTTFDERYAHFSPGVLIQRENLALLEQTGIEWCDSCAAADHPMIDRIWRERRAIGRLSIAIGGPLRRVMFRALAHAEIARNPAGLRQ
jgi:CelD/BcsL family acetyltransferase involved in cellulose biosynthesis